MRQLVREWAVEGAQEREESFGRLLEELEEVYTQHLAKDLKIDKKDVQVLIPGSGLGRLPLEVFAR